MTGSCLERPAAPLGCWSCRTWPGAGPPLVHTASRGAILGLTFATTQAEIAKAILEGLTFELRINLDLLRQAGIEISELHAVVVARAVHCGCSSRPISAGCRCGDLT